MNKADHKRISSLHKKMRKVVVKDLNHPLWTLYVDVEDVLLGRPLERKEKEIIKELEDAI